MDKVKVRFFDDEEMHGEVDRLDLEEPDFLLVIEDESDVSNNEVAWIPLSAVKMIEFAKPVVSQQTGDRRKVAIRFSDGEVVKGYVNGGLERRRYGLLVAIDPSTLDLDRPGSTHGLHLGIPYTAIKALFYVRDWDGRTDAQGQPSASYLHRRIMAPLVDVLSEIDMLAKLKDDGLLNSQEFEHKRTILLERP